MPLRNFHMLPAEKGNCPALSIIFIEQFCWKWKFQTKRFTNSPLKSATGAVYIFNNFIHAKHHCVNVWLHFSVMLFISAVLLEGSWGVNWTNPSFLPVKWHPLQSKAADYRSEGKFLNKFIPILWAIKNILGELRWHLEQKNLFRLWRSLIRNWTRSNCS